MADPRDPDLIQIISKLQGDLDELTKNVISRAGRVPHVAADPASPPDGSDWIRSDTGEWRYRANGVTVALDARYVPRVGGVLLTSNMLGIATSSVTDITWDTEPSDPDGWHAGVGAPLVVPAGKGMRYIVGYSGRWSASPTSQTIAMVLNGTPTYELSPGTLGVGTNWVPTLAFPITFAAGDTIKFTATQSSGSTRDLVSRLEIAPV